MKFWRVWAILLGLSLMIGETIRSWGQGRNPLLTWNCKHIANAQIQGKLAEISLDFGYVLPIICTPNELMGD